MSILAYFIIFWGFPSIPINFEQFLSHWYLCKNIYRYFFDISVKFNYRNIHIYHISNTAWTFICVRILVFLSRVMLKEYFADLVRSTYYYPIKKAKKRILRDILKSNIINWRERERERDFSSIKISLACTLIF